MKPSDLYVWVHTWWGRDGTSLPYEQSIMDSDLSDWIVHKQPKSRERNEFYLAVLRKFLKSGRPFMLRLEDDVHVNRFIQHNVINWQALRDPKFGIGFLSTSARMHRMLHPKQCKYPNTLTYNKLNNHFGGGWVASAKAIKAAIPDIKAILDCVNQSGGFGPTTAVNDAMVRTGWRCFLHDPAIVEVDLSIPSHRFGTKTNRYGAQPFEPEWRA